MTYLQTWAGIFRFFLALSAALAICLAQSAKVVTPRAADAWPQFRGNPQLTGVAASAPPSSLKVLWTFEVGESIESSAAISNGTVFVGSQKGELLALNFNDGTLRWRYQAAREGIGESSPAVAGDTVFVGDV